MARLIQKILKNPSERVLISISPANYTHNDDGSIVLKNSTRMRLYFDRDFLSTHDFKEDRLDLLAFNEVRLALVFRVSKEGRRLTPISKSGRSEIGVPLSVLTTLTPDDFPPARKLQCSYHFVDDKLLVALPFAHPAP